MIGRLNGKLIEKQAPYLLIDVNGIGYEVETSMNTYFGLPEVGATVAIYCQLVVREDGHFLFGFKQKDEKQLFRALIKTSGVGPRLALSILSSMTVEQFLNAVRNNDTVNLVRIPGIGKKTAQRLILDLKDKLKDWGMDNDATQLPAGEGAQQEAISALVALGYKQAEAMRMVQSVNDGQEESEQLIRKALQATLKT